MKFTKVAGAVLLAGGVSVAALAGSGVASAGGLDDQPHSGGGGTTTTSSVTTTTNRDSFNTVTTNRDSFNVYDTTSTVNKVNTLSGNFNRNTVFSFNTVTVNSSWTLIGINNFYNYYGG